MSFLSEKSLQRIDFFDRNLIGRTFEGQYVQHLSIRTNKLLRDVILLMDTDPEFEVWLMQFYKELEAICISDKWYPQLGLMMKTQMQYTVVYCNLNRLPFGRYLFKFNGIRIENKQIYFDIKEQTENCTAGLTLSQSATQLLTNAMGLVHKIVDLVMRSRFRGVRKFVGRCLLLSFKFGVRLAAWTYENGRSEMQDLVNLYFMQFLQQSPSSAKTLKLGYIRKDDDEEEEEEEEEAEELQKDNDNENIDEKELDES